MANKEPLFQVTTNKGVMLRLQLEGEKDVKFEVKSGEVDAKLLLSLIRAAHRALAQMILEKTARPEDLFIAVQHVLQWFNIVLINMRKTISLKMAAHLVGFINKVMERKGQSYQLMPDAQMQRRDEARRVPKNGA